MNEVAEEYRDYNENVGRKFKLKSGGWTSYFKPIVWINFICAPINVFCVLIAILISCLVDNRVKIFCYYAVPNYNRCRFVFIQKIIHFFFYFVFVSDDVHRSNRKRRSKEYNEYDYQPTKEKVSFGWYILGFWFSLIGIILGLVLRKKEPAKAKRLLIGAAVKIAIIALYAISIIIGLIQIS